MNKISLSILALAALSSATYARVSDNCFDYCSTQWNKATITADSPLAVEENYERMENIFEGNQRGR